MPPLPIASRCEAIDASGIRKVFELAARRRAAGADDLIDLSIGQPDFAVPDPIKQAAIRAIGDDFSGYTVTQGIESLRAKVADDYRARFNCQPQAVMITSGVSGGLTLALLATCEVGDEVIVIDPYFVMYKHLVTLTGANSVIIDSYDDFALPIDRIADAVTARTRVIILNSPGNPTGCVYDSGELAEIVELAERHNLMIISDEIYRSLWYEEPPPSPATLAADRTLLLDGFSKSLAMTGWRVGYAVGPAAVIEQMTKLQQYTFVCAPSFAQQAALAADQCDLEPIRADYRSRRDLVYEGLARRFEVVKPAGGFYIFPKSPMQPASKFVTLALERNVLTIPGAVFSDSDTHFRISYARSEDQLRRGVDILCELADDVMGN